MTVTVRIPTPLRVYTDGADELAMEGATVGAVLDRLAGTCEGIRDRLLYGQGELRHFVNVFVGRHDVRTQQGLETPVADGDVTSIIPAVAGGTTRVDP